MPSITMNPPDGSTVPCTFTVDGTYAPAGATVNVLLKGSPVEVNAADGVWHSATLGPFGPGETLTLRACADDGNVPVCVEATYTTRNPC